VDPDPKLTAGGRATLSDVARRAGVSSMIVSRVLNTPGLVRAPTRARIEQAMRELGYVPNRAARSLVVNRLGVLALLIPDVSNPFFPLLVRGVEQAAGAAGFTVLLGNSDEDYDKERVYLMAVASLRVDGVLVVAAGSRSRESLELLTALGIPFVLIGREVDGVTSDLVRGDSRQAARLVVEHLIAHGHRRLGIISGPPDNSTARDRERGYRDALAASGLAVDPPLVSHTTYTRQAGYAAGLELLARTDRPTAVFTANNLVGSGLLAAARELGLAVPRDLAVASFDNVEVGLEHPFLTSAVQPAEVIGRTAARLLLDRLNGDDSPHREVVLASEVRIPSSCGCSSMAPIVPMLDPYGGGDAPPTPKGSA
jgi:LacI family transcriptional regulator